MRAKQRMGIQPNIRNKGTTIIEMVVCFALLSIFISSAAMIITSVTNLYYQVKGETFSNQVSDIIMERIAKEVEGAKYDDTYDFAAGGNPVIDDKGDYITLYNRSDTKVKIFAKDEELMVEYAEIQNSNPSKAREATVWKYDDGVYNQYRIKQLRFVPGDKISLAGSYGINLSDYGVNAADLEYNQNVVVVFLTINSPRYGTYRTFRPIKMYYVPETSTTP